MTAPNLPAVWNTAVVGTGNPWTTVSTSSVTPPNSAFGFDGAAVADETLVTPALNIVTATAQLTFKNRWTFENSGGSFYDGGVLEISINGGAFTDIVTAGGSFVSGGYTGVISASFSNPLASRNAWAGVSTGYPAYLTSVVNLPAAAAGTQVQLQWRIGTDTSAGAAGQNIDSVLLLDGTNVCIPGTGTLNCDDGNPCTDDFCDPTLGCQHANNNASCDDGNACTILDACNGGSCSGNVIFCNDSNVCTTDTCNPASGCVFTNNTNACNDGNACTVGDVCGGGSCQPGTGSLNCDDNNPCTNDSCVPATGCAHANNTAACSDNNACTVGDVCGGGSCQPGTGTLVCNDGNVCTTDSCVPATGCSFTNNTAACSDNNACTVGDVCGGGSCQPGTGTLVCNDGNVCTTDSCVPATGCSFTNNTNACDDGNACTVGDACAGGVCAGTSAPIPAETQNVNADATKTTYSWSATAFATRYDVVRGSTGALPVGPGGADEVCFDNLAGPTLTDPAVPAAGSGFWYLSRAENACGNGTYGTQGVHGVPGAARVSTTCP